LTIVRGIYCDRCRVRYAYHVCKEGMPCEHHFAEVARDWLGIIAPANLIYCESWRYIGGFKRFELQQLYYIYDKETGEWHKRWVEQKHFKASYVTEEELIDLFLKFMKEKLSVSEWAPFVEAFISLYIGGKSSSYPPAWRMRQLARKQKSAGNY